MNDELTITEGVPMPKDERRTRYPFRKMKVGDSFLVNFNDWDKVRSASYQWGRRHKKTFTCRRTEEGIRCWRTE